jgi:hypothetical protein
MNQISFTILTALTFIGHALLEAEQLKRVDETHAKKLFTEHLKKLDKRLEDYTYSFEPFRKSTWMISCIPRAMELGGVGWRHVMNSRGEIEELSIGSLNVVFMNEYPSSPEKTQQEELMRDFVSLHSGEKTPVINGIVDIPGYEKSKLDPDIEDALRAPFKFGNLVWVVYTYQQHGGIVRRYRFEFENGNRFRRAECAKVGAGIGDAQLWE